MVSNLEILNIRLDRLKEIYKVTDDIKIVLESSKVGQKAGCRGRVIDTTIFILEDDLEKALELLDHEFFEYVLKDHTNELFRLNNSHIKMFH